MPRYLIGRIFQAALVLWASFTVAFILLQVLPGDAILIKFQSPDMGLSPQQIARGDLWNAVTLDETLSLSAFTRAGRTQKNDTYHFLLTSSLPPKGPSRYRPPPERSNFPRLPHGRAARLRYGRGTTGRPLRYSCRLLEPNS